MPALRADEVIEVKERRLRRGIPGDLRHVVDDPQGQGCLVVDALIVPRRGS